MPMHDLLWMAVHQLLRCDNISTAPARDALWRGGPRAGVVVSLNPSKRTKSELAGQAFGYARCFLALPSFNSPRWLFPLGNSRSALAGLEIYKPYARTARVLKSFLKAAVVAHCLPFASNRMLLVSQGPLPLEDLVREVTGERQTVFSLSIGTEPRFRKLTVQVMRPEGEILGYIKLPLTDAAVERVRHEAETLNCLWSFPALRPHIPRVLYFGEWGEGDILFQSGGPPWPGPAQFNDHYQEFLQLLWGIQAAQKPGHVLCEEVAARWRKTEPSLCSAWRALGQAALAEARRELEGVMVPCGVSHGDFAPWNTRIGDQGLFVFDWESASWESPTLWDAFHFKTQVAVLLKKRNHVHLSQEPHSGERASFMLYLLSSACRLFSEEGPAQSVGLEFRRELLAKELGGY